MVSTKVPNRGQHDVPAVDSDPKDKTPAQVPNDEIVTRAGNSRRAVTVRTT